jgi:hypothetical protein
MTLVEVLAALLLMGSMLVGLVAARGRLLAQRAHAADKQDAVRAADALLASWWATDPPSVPVSGSGEVAGHTGWVWEVETVAGVVPEELPVDVARLIIRDQRDPQQPRVLVAVKVLVPPEASLPDPDLEAVP